MGIVQRGQRSPNYDGVILPLPATVELTGVVTDSTVHLDTALLWLHVLYSMEAQQVENDQAYTNKALGKIKHLMINILLGCKRVTLGLSYCNNKTRL